MGCHGAEAEREWKRKVFNGESGSSCCCHCDELATRH